MFRVIVHHKELGKIIVDNVKEIHFNYPTLNVGSRSGNVAFECDEHGVNYSISDVLEFEGMEYST